MRNLLREVHKWVGLGVFLLILLQASTGFMLAHKETLRRIFTPELSQIEDRHALNFDAVQAEVEARFSDAAIERLTFDKRNPNILIGRLYDQKGDLSILMIDGGSGRIISSGPVWRYPLEVAERLHVSLMAGQVGYVILITEGLLLVGLSVTGLILWWPKGSWKKALTIRWSAPRALLLRDLHTIPSALLSPLYIIVGLTGAMMIGESAIKPVVAVVAPVAPELEITLAEIPQPEKMISVNQSYDLLVKEFPGASMRQLRFFAQGRVIGTVMVDHDMLNPRAHHLAGVDRWSGELYVYSNAKKRPGGEVFLEWLLPIHNGEAWGPVRWLVESLIALGLALGSILGAWMWLHRRARKRAAPL